MKAIAITKPGGPEVLQVQERPVPEPGSHQVLIQVKAAGINRPDIAQRKGHYPPPPGAVQDIPGLEVAGVIERLGSDVKRWKIGDSVCALISGGGYAEFALAEENHCLAIPQQLDFTGAASLPETVFTVWHNVFQKGGLKENEKFLVHGGTSGIGITAIQLAKAFGATVFTTCGTDDKCKAAISIGADKCINYKKEDFETILKEEGADVILDMVGGEYIPKNIRLLNTDGRLVFINAMTGSKAEFDALDIMRRRLTITGSTLRNRHPQFKAQLAEAVEKNVWPLLVNGKFRPHIFETFPLEQASQAHTMLESGSHIGKIVLVTGSGSL